MTNADVFKFPRHRKAMKKKDGTKNGKKKWYQNRGKIIPIIGAKWATKTGTKHIWKNKGEKKASVVGRVRGPCCGTCSGPMLWDVFGAHVVGRVRGPCCGTCSGPMLWDVFGAHVVGHVRGLWHDHDVEMGQHIEFA